MPNLKASFLNERELSERPLISDWLTAFRQYSFNNDMYGVLALHTIIGQLIRKTKIIIGSQILDPRVSIFLLQNSGSGKTLGWNLVEQVSKELKLNVKNIVEATDASLVGSFKERKVKKKDPIDNSTTQTLEYDETEGALKHADILHYDEASTLLIKSNHSQKALFYFQVALNSLHTNSNIIEKDLTSGSITLKPYCSCYFTSFMPKGMEEIALETGLLQRCITFPRHLSEKVRLQNEEHNRNLAFSATTPPNIKNLVSQLTKFKKHNSKEFSLALQPNLKPMFHSTQTHIRQELLKNITPEVREIMETFFSRLLNHLIVLSIHSSIIRNDAYNIISSDITYASRIMFHTFKHLINWFESDLTIISPQKENRKLRYQKLILQFLKTPDKFGLTVYKHGLSQADLIKLASEKLSISIPTASTHVPTFVAQTHHFHMKRISNSAFYHPLKPYQSYYTWWKKQNGN